MYKIGLITLCLLVMSSLTYGQKHKQQDPYSDVTRQNQVLFNQIMIKPPVTPDYQPQSESGNRMVTMRRCPVKGCRIIYVSSDYYEAHLCAEHSIGCNSDNEPSSSSSAHVGHSRVTPAVTGGGGSGAGPGASTTPRNTPSAPAEKPAPIIAAPDIKAGTEEYIFNLTQAEIRVFFLRNGHMTSQVVQPWKDKGVAEEPPKITTSDPAKVSAVRVLTTDKGTAMGTLKCIITDLGIEIHNQFDPDLELTTTTP